MWRKKKTGMSSMGGKGMFCMGGKVKLPELYSPPEPFYHLNQLISL